jgi:hypothetical protein
MTDVVVVVTMKTGIGLLFLFIGVGVVVRRCSYNIRLFYTGEKGNHHKPICADFLNEESQTWQKY